MGAPIYQKMILGGKEIETVVIPMPQANLIIAVARKGFIMCGYLDIHTAEKLQDAAGVVRGVKSADDLLNAAVVSVTSRAAMLGVNIGDTARDALMKMS